MNLQQQIACSRATEGHNLLLLGKSGTGKSFCVKHIFKSLTEKGNHTVQCFNSLAVLKALSCPVSGTGKSFCVKHIFKSLTEKGNHTVQCFNSLAVLKALSCPVSGSESHIYVLSCVC